MVTARIVAQGEELVTGARADTNTAQIAGWLTERGVRVLGGMLACDSLPELVRAYRAAAGGVDLVVSTGGLGPTSDDLTSEAVAEAAGLPRRLDPEALAQVEAAFARVRRPMPAVNTRQAVLPDPSTVVPNPTGTAPGFVAAVAGTPVICLPGVPSEMERMMRDTVLPWIEARFSLQPALRRTFRVVGVGESQLQERLDDLIRDVGSAGGQVGFRALMPENQVKLVVPAATPGAGDLFDRATAALRARLGIDCFGEDGVSLPEALGRLLVARGVRVATAESCTGGLVAEILTSVAGSSAWFERGWVTYSNAAKEAELGVPRALIEAHGAVSDDVCAAMAAGARARSGAAYAVAVTGVAGPGGGSEAKPIGTVHIAHAGPDGASSRRFHFGRDREQNRRFAAFAAIERLRRHLVRADEGTPFAAAGPRRTGR